MKKYEYAGPARGLCTLPELLEAMLLFLPVGVALSCLETSVAAGLVVIDGEVYPGRSGGGSLAEMERVNFRPWIPHLSEQQYTVIQRMCDPIGAMISTVHVTHLLCVHSDKIAANALERGWISASHLKQIREPAHREFWRDAVASFIDRPPEGYNGDPIAWARDAVQILDPQ